MEAEARRGEAQRLLVADSGAGRECGVGVSSCYRSSGIHTVMEAPHCLLSRCCSQARRAASSHAASKAGGGACAEQQAGPAGERDGRGQPNPRGSLIEPCDSLILCCRQAGRCGAHPMITKTKCNAYATSQQCMGMTLKKRKAAGGRSKEDAVVRSTRDGGPKQSGQSLKAEGRREKLLTQEYNKQNVWTEAGLTEEIEVHSIHRRSGIAPMRAGLASPALPPPEARRCAARSS